MDVDSNCLCVSTQFEAPEAEGLESHTSGDVRVLEGITWMKVLQAYHGMGLAFLVHLVIVSVELFEWLHQRLLPPVDIGLVHTGVDIPHVGVCLDLKHLLGVGCYLSHFEGAGVPIQNEFPLCFDGIIVAPPQSDVIISNLFHLCVPLDALLAGTTWGPHLSVENLVGWPYCCILSVWASETVISHWWLRTGVSDALLWVTLWARLLFILNGFNPLTPMMESLSWSSILPGSSTPQCHQRHPSLFPPPGSGSSIFAGLPGNQLVLPYILLALFVEQLPLELGLCLSDCMQLPQTHAEVESFVSLWTPLLGSAEGCSWGQEQQHK